MSEYPYDYDESEWNIVRELEKVILSRPDGIVLSANQYTSETIQELLLRAKAQGIKILLCDSDAEAPMRDCFVGSDNVESGKNAARLAAEKTDSGEILVFIESDEKDSRAAQTRLDAFRAEIEQAGCRARVKEIRLSDVPEEHYDQICETLLETGEENRTVICFKSSFTSVIAQAIQRLGLEDTCEFIGFCESEEAFEYASLHVIDILFVQDIVQLGYQTVECMDKLLHGGLLETDIILIDMDVYRG